MDKKRFATVAESQELPTTVKRAFGLQDAPEPEGQFAQLLADQARREAQIRENRMKFGGYEPEAEPHVDWSSRVAAAQTYHQPNQELGTKGFDHWSQYDMSGQSVSRIGTPNDAQGQGVRSASGNAWKRAGVEAVDMSADEVRSLRAQGPTIFDPTFERLAEEAAMRDLRRKAMRAGAWLGEEKRKREQQSRQHHALRERQEVLDRMSPLAATRCARIGNDQVVESRFGMYDYTGMAAREEQRQELAYAKMTRKASIKAREEDGSPRKIQEQRHKDWELANLLDPPRARTMQEGTQNDALLRKMFPDVF